MILPATLLRLRVPAVLLVIHLVCGVCVCVCVCVCDVVYGVYVCGISGMYMYMLV